MEISDESIILVRPQPPLELWKNERRSPTERNENFTTSPS
jgi:hypothetical protein